VKPKGQSSKPEELKARIGCWGGAACLTARGPWKLEPLYAPPVGLGATPVAKAYDVS